MARFEVLPLDVMALILHRLRLRDVYACRCVSKAVGATTRSAQKEMVYHHDTFGGVVSRNLRLLARDFSLNYVPLVTDKMTSTMFRVYAKAFRPTTYHLNPGTCNQWVYKSVLRRTPSSLTSLSLDVDHRNVRSLVLSSVETPNFSPTLTSLTLNAVGGLTIDVMMDVMKLPVSAQRVRTLILTGLVESMEVIYDLLPRDLRHLRIEATVGVHDVRSLTRFIELGLEHLSLLQCYEVCEHPACANYTAIGDAIMRSASVPERLSLSPFPAKALVWCVGRGVEVDFADSSFFDHELEGVECLERALDGHLGTF